MTGPARLAHDVVMPERSRKPRPVVPFRVDHMVETDAKLASVARSRNRKLDLSQLAKSIVDEATREVVPEAEPHKDPAAVALGRRGGLKGGRARAESLSPEQRREIAKRAAAARWADKHQAP